MTKNVYLQQIRKIKEEAYRDGVWEGMQFMLNLVAISANRKFNFGDKRLSILEADVQELVNEVVDTGDPLVNKVHIERELKRIRGQDWNK